MSEAHSNCPICSKSLLSRSFMEHMAESHSEQLIAVCKVCHQLFSPDSIEDHIVRCKGSFVCLQCRATFACSSYLHRHINRKHSSTVRPVCDRCGKSFSSRSALCYHERLHTGTFKHSCELCNASFSQRCNLKMHMDSHHAYVELRGLHKPFTCDTCGRGFLFSCSLQNHRLQHLKFPKDLECTDCGRRFSFRSELNRHLVTHSRRPTNQCPFCMKLFARNNLLKSHMLQHMTPDVLTCQYCFRTFASRSYLVKHVKKHESQLSGLTETSDYHPILLTEDFATNSIDQKTFVDEALLDRYDDVLLQHPIHPDVNLLHAILYDNTSNSHDKEKSAITNSNEEDSPD